MSDLSVFEKPVEEKSIYYYIFQLGYPLFKGSFLTEGDSIVLHPDVPYFFGLKNTDPEYIEAYEEEYGVIFEYKTTREYKLLALDKRESKQYVYDMAEDKGRSDIQDIVIKNYGLHTGIRDSVGEKDSELSKFICELGLDGYAIHTMKTDMGGTFHPELLICNRDGIEEVSVVTKEDSIEGIKEIGTLRKISKLTRKKKSGVSRRKGSPSKGSTTRRLFSDDSSPSKKVSKSLFSDDSKPPQVSRKLFGGKKKTKRNKKHK